MSERLTLKKTIMQVSLNGFQNSFKTECKRDREAVQKHEKSSRR